MNKKLTKTKKPNYLKKISEDISAIRTSLALLVSSDTLIKSINENKSLNIEPSAEGYITFPEKTAQEIVNECDNKIAGGKLLWNTDWYKNEDFYTKEKCRSKTVKIPTEIELPGKSWNECHESSPDDVFNFAEITYMLRESESFRKLLASSNDVRYTWTSSRASDGRLVVAGYFSSDGAGVDRGGPRDTGSLVGVCLSRS